MIEAEDRNEKNNEKKPTRGETKSNTPVLDNFSRDLIKLAKEGKLDPVVGRDSEITRLAQIISRRKKNNPILVGEPGCVLGDTIIEIEKISNDDSHKIEIM
jgi:ATP-dependent Clp protease ATP-binding subunit ClpC